MTAVAHKPQPHKTIEDRRKALAQREAALYIRLEDGYQRIEQALKAGKSVPTWEEFWLQLLAEYEQVCDEYYRLTTD